MPGVKGRSGRRRILAPAKDLKLPPLGGTEESVGRYVAAVNRAIVERKLDRADGDVLIKGARVRLAATSLRAQRTDVPELRKLLVETKEVVLSGLKQAADGRQAAPVVFEPDAPAEGGEPTTKKRQTN